MQRPSNSQRQVQTRESGVQDCFLQERNKLFFRILEGDFTIELLAYRVDQLKERYG
jgi:hypothetical protein